METNSIGSAVSLAGDLTAWLLTWSWQIFLLLGAACAALKLDRSRSSATRYRIWLISLVAVAMIPLLGLLARTLQLPAAISPSLFPVVGTRDYVPLAPLERSDEPVISWFAMGSLSLLAVWACGVVVSFTRLAGSLWKLHRSRCGAQPVSAAEMGCYCPDVLRRSVPIALSSEIQSPGLAGFFRPVIVLPADIGSWTTPEERLSILRHEFAHLDRRDHLVSLFQSVLQALLFFHPMVRYACSRLSLERELACDDRVLRLGTEPNAYVESILKAAERSFLATDVVHQIAPFASKKNLERRIAMIMDAGRRAQPRRQWQFLLLPLLLIGIMTWLTLPAASRETEFDDESAPPGTNPTPGPQRSIDKAAIWVDTVRRGSMVFRVRGLGTLRSAGSARLIAQITIPEGQAKAIESGQPASVDTRKGIVSGRVMDRNPRVRNGIVVVNISLDGTVPGGVRPGLEVDGVIEIGRLDDVLYVGRPVHGGPDSSSSLFRIEEDGRSATRVRVRFGRVSVNTIEIVDGLKVGDKVIISDMSTFDGVETIKLN